MLTVNLEPSGVLQLCSGGNITFVCTNNVNQSELLAWRAVDENHPDGDPYFFTNTDEVDIERFSGGFTLLLKSRSPLVSTATLTNIFSPQQNGTNLTCSSTTASRPSPSKADYAVLILKGTQYILFFSCVCVCISVYV